MIRMLLLAACVAALAAPAAASASVPADRSLSDQGRLSELEIDIRAAHDRGEIDRATFGELALGIARIRRQIVHLGMQVGYRQRVRLRARIDRLYAPLAEVRALRAR